MIVVPKPTSIHNAGHGYAYSPHHHHYPRQTLPSYPQQHHQSIPQGSIPLLDQLMASSQAIYSQQSIPHPHRARKTKNPHLSLVPRTPSDSNFVGQQGESVTATTLPVSPRMQRHSKRSFYNPEFDMALDISDMQTHSPPVTPSPVQTPPGSAHPVMQRFPFESQSYFPSPPSTPTRSLHFRSPSAPIQHPHSHHHAMSASSLYPSAPVSPSRDRFANSHFQNSPPPNTLPKPKFLSGSGSLGDVFA